MGRWVQWVAVDPNWAGLVRAGERYLYVEELDGIGWRGGLEIKPPEMWADHVCDAPMRQWSLGNESHGVLLDDPTEAWRRAHGTGDRGCDPARPRAHRAAAGRAAERVPELHDGEPLSISSDRVI